MKYKNEFIFLSTAILLFQNGVSSIFILYVLIACILKFQVLNHVIKSMLILLPLCMIDEWDFVLIADAGACLFSRR
jgi:hypothetical protein